MPTMKARFRPLQRILDRLHALPKAKQDAVSAAAVEYRAGNKRPLLDLLKEIFTNPDTWALLLKLLPLLLAFL